MAPSKARAKKPAVVIKFFEVNNWLFSSEVELPEKFKMNPNKLTGIVPYLTEQFWTQPQLIAYLNKYTNELYGIPDPLEMLKLLKKIILTRGLTKASCWNFMPNRQPNLLKELKERDDLDDGNARSKRMLMKKLHVDSSHYFKAAPTKKNTNLHDSASKVIIKEAIVQSEKLQKIAKEEERVNDSRFLTKLNQEIIDELDLVLFDISLLKKTNRVLFTFIDQDNLKRYFIVPFMAEIYLSKKDGVVNNDYIEDLNDIDFIKYVIRDHKLYNKLKYILNTSYKKALNLPGVGIGRDFNYE